MINGVTLKVNVDDYILNTLKEDITSEDVSTNAVMPEDKQGKAELICKQDGIICGLGIFERTFELLDKTARFEAYFKDGDEVKKGELLGVIYGDIKAILSGERTGLNYLQRMSGIATMTREYMKELEGTNTTLLDTRKTTPNMRPFENMRSVSVEDIIIDIIFPTVYFLKTIISVRQAQLQRQLKWLRRMLLL